ncbi:MAG: hypothetical protein V1789_03700 [PVC group bacterium]
MTAAVENGVIILGPEYTPARSFEALAPSYACDARALVQYQDENGNTVSDVFSAELTLTLRAATPTPPPPPTPIPATPVPIATLMQSTPPPTPVPPLEVEIAGPSEVVAHCAVIYTALISGGVPPYSEAWAPQLTGSFRSTGEKTLLCAVRDASDQRASAEFNVLVYEFGCEVGSASTEEVEDSSKKERLTPDINGFGPPPGNVIPISFSESVAKNASLSVSISAGVGPVSASLGYSHGQSISATASASYPVQLSDGQKAYLYAYPVYAITIGDVVCRNCERIYDTGVYIGKKLSHWSVYLEVE